MVGVSSPLGIEKSSGMALNFRKWAALETALAFVLSMAA
jgi:hypothetical protein